MSGLGTLGAGPGKQPAPPEVLLLQALAGSPPQGAQAALEWEDLRAIALQMLSCCAALEEGAELQG